MTDFETRAQEVWDRLERIRGIYHRNDQPAYVASYAQALRQAYEDGLDDAAQACDRHAKIYSILQNIGAIGEVKAAETLAQNVRALKGKK